MKVKINKFQKIGIILALSCSTILGLSLINYSDEVKGNENEGIVKVGDKVYSASDLFDEVLVYDETFTDYDKNFLKISTLYAYIDKYYIAEKEEIDSYNTFLDYSDGLALFEDMSDEEIKDYININVKYNKYLSKNNETFSDEKLKKIYDEIKNKKMYKVIDISLPIDEYSQGISEEKLNNIYKDIEKGYSVLQLNYKYAETYGVYFFGRSVSEVNNGILGIGSTFNEISKLKVGEVDKSKEEEENNLSYLVAEKDLSFNDFKNIYIDDIKYDMGYVNEDIFNLLINESDVSVTDEKYKKLIKPISISDAY